MALRLPLLYLRFFKMFRSFRDLWKHFGHADRHEGGLTLPLSSYDAGLVGVHTRHLHTVLQSPTGTTAADFVAPSRTSTSRHLDTSVLLHQKL